MVSHGDHARAPVRNAARENLQNHPANTVPAETITGRCAGADWQTRSVLR